MPLKAKWPNLAPVSRRSVAEALVTVTIALASKKPAGSAQRRKRSVFYNVLGYAVEQGHLTSNPVDRVQ